MKKIWWSLVVVLLFGACQNHQDAKKKPVEEKQVVKDESALQYHMFKVEKATPQEVAIKFKDFLEGEGLYYPRFIDFHKAAQIDEMPFEMRPTILVIFGHPKEMGRLINENQETAIDLPFRILVFQDSNGDVWVMYKDFKAFGKQFFLSDPDKILDKYAQMLNKFEAKIIEWTTNKTAI